ncbi:hypothetical protein HELRODRAFT_175639 [Helobdella robusta]|uniref:Uncharacterized protein n=1 Tax=Helobdella robusta TaxID=6412 RepID=T1F9G3_HELRO|nr:hypothetical protein HELRODRAFT_175639 [Helobdella robusta]ESO00659.1 hypothetical protein HELRODRAFT_175639 [Helobdella robusta]
MRRMLCDEHRICHGQFVREILLWSLPFTELKEVIDQSGPCLAGLETSAKKNINIEEAFIKLFLLARLPTEMSPSLHRKVQPTYVANFESTEKSRSGNRRLMSLRRRLSDACGAVAINARRPSIRTDMMNLQMKQQNKQTSSVTSSSTLSHEQGGGGGGSDGDIGKELMAFKNCSLQ